MFNIVLFNPQIPQNTGNIVRTCVVSGAKLHLIKPLGFKIDDKSLKRAGLDYWLDADIFIYEDFNDFEEKNKIKNLYLISTKADKIYSEEKFYNDDFFVFGSETKGLPKEIHDKYLDNRLKIPMLDKESARCLNLSNSVCVILYEALRQNNFLNLK